MTHLEFMASVAAIAGAVNFAFTGGQVALVHLAPPQIEGKGRVAGPVSPGSIVAVDWTIIKRTNCPGVNARVWQGQNGFHLTEEFRPAALPQTTNPTSYRIETRVPDLAPPGDLSMTIEGVYQCPGGAKFSFSLGPVNMVVTE